jgi:hypothetical protein
MLKENDPMPKVCPLNHRIFTIPTTMVWGVVMFSLLACQDMFKGMGEMMVLQQKLAKEFNTQNIGIKITNGTHLGVTFQNSEIAKLPEFEQESKARQIALFVREHYEGSRNLSTISVVFIQQDKYGPVSVTKSQAVFLFKPSELGQGEMSSTVSIQFQDCSYVASSGRFSE